MSLFQNFHPAGDFAPLFRLLDDYDAHRSRGQTSVRSFAPHFDVRETSEAYLLDGELPGVAQKDIDIEFSDHQTLVIKGRIEREYHSHTPQAEDTSETSDTQNESREVVETGEKGVTKAKNQHRYWARERSVGEFHRSFSFPTRVDQDNVKASLKNGILSIVVPKTTAPGSKKITIE